MSLFEKNTTPDQNLGEDQNQNQNHSNHSINNDGNDDKKDFISHKENYLEDSTSLEFDMVGLEANDTILHNKMKLINDAIDEIGFTPYHLKLFFLNGMGYCTDCMLTYLESSVRTFINYQFGYKFPVSNECYAGGMILEH